MVTNIQRFYYQYVSLLEMESVSLVIKKDRLPRFGHKDDVHCGGTLKCGGLRKKKIAGVVKRRYK